jgi:hypothetical protein
MVANNVTDHKALIVEYNNTRGMFDPVLAAEPG